MPNIKNKQIVKYSIVFGNHMTDIMDMLRCIDKSTAIKIIAHLNHVARSRVTSSVDDILNKWFGTSNARFREMMKYIIKMRYREIGVKYDGLTIINMWSNLKILDFLLSEPEKNKIPKKTGDESERDFFMVYLAMNEVFADGSNTLVESLREKENGHLDWYAKALMGTLIKYHDFANTKANETMASHIIRTYYIFLFLENNGHGELKALFLEKYGLINWVEYFKFILPIATRPLYEGDGSGLYYFQLEKNKENNLHDSFIRQLALKGSESYPIETDFLAVRSRPLYETETGRFLVCDIILNLNRVHNSMLFELKDLAVANSHLHTAYRNFLSFYTTEYVEKYLSYKVLKDIFFESGYVQLSGEEIKSTYGVNKEPDYYIRNKNKVFLFEVKGSMVTGSAKQSFEYGEIEEELIKKYYKKPSNGQRIGILQLVDRIEVLLSECVAVPFDPDADQKRLEIYPILLVTERSLNTPGISHIFNRLFDADIEGNEVLTARKYQIKPLTIIDMDTLICFCDMFRKNHVFMEESIRAYHRYVQVKTPDKKYKQSKVELERNINLSLLSYADFLHENYKPDLPELFMRIMKEIIGDG